MYKTLFAYTNQTCWYTALTDTKLINTSNRYWLNGLLNGYNGYNWG